MSADGIRVYCRIRPFNASESSSDAAVAASDDGTQIKLIGLSDRDSLGGGAFPGTPARAPSLGGASAPATPLAAGAKSRQSAAGTPGFASPLPGAGAGGNAQTPSSFNFDRVWPPTATQAEVFNAAGLPLVKDLMEGYVLAS